MNLEHPWLLPGDTSAPIINARRLMQNKPNLRDFPGLPPRAVLFCLGKGLPIFEKRFAFETLIDPLKCFINQTRVLTAKGHPGVCFLHGGYGAPAMADTVETLQALGVKEFFLIGLCGGFTEDVQVGDVLAPGKILSEEGTSRHYRMESGFIPLAGPKDHAGREDFFKSKGIALKYRDTVTTDAVYRQTFAKEALWRELGCAGVDMEASAMATLCEYYGLSGEVLLMVSDRHPIHEGEPPWQWGSLDYDALLENFVVSCIEYAVQ